MLRSIKFRIQKFALFFVFFRYFTHQSIYRLTIT
jgi:hypothetical protein